MYRGIAILPGMEGQTSWYGYSAFKKRIRYLFFVLPVNKIYIYFLKERWGSMVSLRHDGNYFRKIMK